MFKLLFIPTAENKYEPYLLRKAALFFYTFVLVFVNILPGSISGLATKVAADSITAETLISYANKERQFYELDELSTSTQLTTAAYAKANNMLEKQYWDHFGPDGETPWQYIRGVGYDYVYAGENLAKGFKSSEGVHQAWMASPTHRENILSENYKEIGIAVVSGNLLGEDMVLVVEMFGNTTTEIQKAVSPEILKQPSQNVVPAENGQIKSIKITSPKSGAVINDPKVTIIGEVDGTSGKYSVSIRDNSQIMGTVTSISPQWEFTSTKALSEGDHSLVANIGSGNEKVEDKITIEIDTTPPQISANSISVVGRKIIVGISETDLVVALVLDGQIYKVEPDADGTYSVTIPSTITAVQKATLFASDSVGNTMEIDVLDIVSKALEYKESNSQILGVSSIFSGITGKDFINLVLASFIGILLVIEIAYYRRLGKLHERVYSVFFVSIWWLMAVYSVIVCFGGSINV